MKLKGFSLVELMVTLIVISLIIASLSPIVTKKLKSSSITIGATTNVIQSEENKCKGQICSDGYYPNKWENCKCSPCSVPFCKQCEDNVCSECIAGYNLVDGKCQGGTKSCQESGGKPTQACCESLGAMYLPKATTGLSQDLCMMKYNAFDGDYVGAEASKIAVKLVSIDSICKTESCCWKGYDNHKSSSSCKGEQNGDSTYSPCTRTICQYPAAVKICNNWAPSNYAPGAWRLPLKEELNVVANHIDEFSLNQGSAGLQLCASSSIAGADKCDGYPGTGGIACAVSSSEGNTYDDCTPRRIWGQDISYLEFSSSPSVSSQTDKLARPAGVRCVSANVTSGYEASHNVDVTGGEPAGQADCDKFNALFISSKYNGNPSGKNICMTKFNALDNGGPFYPYSSDIAKNDVKLVQRDSQYCDTGSCCWHGVTSASSTDGNGYSGSSRTVCRYSAAQKICNNWNPTGSYKGAWRIPYQEELTSLAQYIQAESSLSYFLNHYLYEQGLQLCDRTVSTGAAKCTVNENSCKISSSSVENGDDCASHSVWGKNGSAFYLLDTLTKIMENVASEAEHFTKSVRCVSEAVLTTDVEDQTVDGMEASEVQEYQKICDKYNALFIPKKYLGTSKNICMTKYNALDANGPLDGYTNEQLLALEPAVTRVQRDKAYCNMGYCCWADANTASSYTSGQNGDSSYSGASRTLCQATAAEVLCKNWAPDSATSGKWRLPNYSELTNLAIYLNNETQHSSFLNSYMGKSGLQLCDKQLSTGIDKCTGLEDAGKAACGISSSEANDKDDCKPNHIWGQNNYYLRLSNGAGVYSVTSSDYPKGVRCVTEVGVN